MSSTGLLQNSLLIYIAYRFLIDDASNARGVTRNFLEGGSKSSKISAEENLGCGTAKTVNFGPFPMRFHVL